MILPARIVEVEGRTEKNNNLVLIQIYDHAYYKKGKSWCSPIRTKVDDRTFRDWGIMKTRLARLQLFGGKDGYAVLNVMGIYKKSNRFESSGEGGIDYEDL